MDLAADSEFVDLRPSVKSTTRHKPAIEVKVLDRGGPNRLQISFAQEVFDRLGGTLLQVSYCSRLYQLRIRSDADGLFPTFVMGRNGTPRRLLRLTLPDALQATDRREPAPHAWGEGNETGTLYITVPPALRKPRDNKTIEAIARQAVPARSFGGKR